MKKAIEAVIKDLTMRQSTCNPDVTLHDRAIDAYYDMGLHAAYGEAISQLEGVLAQHVNSDTNRANGNGTDDGRDGQKDQVETL